jgi:hypothetical protein
MKSMYVLAMCICVECRGTREWKGIRDKKTNMATTKPMTALRGHP